MTRELEGDPDAVEAVLNASQTIVTVAINSLGAAAEEITVAQYRTLVTLTSRHPQRLIDVAAALGVAPSSAGRMCDRLARKGLIRKHRAHRDRRAVHISVTAVGRQVIDEATERHRALAAEILNRLPLATQRAIAEALRKFAEAAGEGPGSQWLPVQPEERP